MGSEMCIRQDYRGQLSEETAGDIIKEYGIDRVRYVLSHTVAHHAQDESISDENKKWAEEIAIGSLWQNHDLLAGCSHP